MPFPFGTAAAPTASVPIRLPFRELPVAWSPFSEIPSLTFPETRFPEIVLAELNTEIPELPLPIGAGAGRIRTDQVPNLPSRCWTPAGSRRRGSRKTTFPAGRPPPTVLASPERTSTPVPFGTAGRPGRVGADVVALDDVPVVVEDCCWISTPFRVFPR